MSSLVCFPSSEAAKPQVASRPTSCLQILSQREVQACHPALLYTHILPETSVNFPHIPSFLWPLICEMAQGRREVRMENKVLTVPDT